MQKNNKRSVILFFGSLLIGALVTWGISQHSQTLAGIPLPWLAMGLAFSINWLAFVPAYVKQTEKFYDLTGSLTYLSVTILLVNLADHMDTRSWVLAAMVGVWAARLGSFLFMRILQDGLDSRFVEIKPDKWRFLSTWTLQGLWVTVTASTAFAAISANERQALGVLAYLGMAIWLLGMALEVIADQQKRRFKTDPANQGRFISSGLWSLCRHPNYLGEILLWTGVALVALPVLSGWQLVALISPVFVTLLLTRLSGIPMLQAKADARWGEDPEYQMYKKVTPKLVPWIGKAG